MVKMLGFAFTLTGCTASFCKFGLPSTNSREIFLAAVPRGDLRSANFDKGLSFRGKDAEAQRTWWDSTGEQPPICFIGGANNRTSVGWIMALRP
jgi:hypothetical protein